MYNICHNITDIPSSNYLIHSHVPYEILYVLTGDVIVSIGGTEFAVEPHTMLLIPSSVFHGIHVLTDRTYDRYAVHFDSNILPQEHRALLMSKLPTKVDSTCCQRNMGNSGIHEMLRHFDELKESPEALHKPLVPIYLLALIAQILMKLPEPDKENKHPSKSRKNELIDYVNIHFTEPLTLEMLSTQFFISKSQLNYIFRTITGTTVIDYIIHKRVSYAQQLLLNGISAQRAGAAAGFGDYTSFYRAYKKCFGCSPNSDRREVSHYGQVGEPTSTKAYLEGEFSVTL